MTADYRPFDVAALTIEQRLALVAEARLTFGVKTARALWEAIGLPSSSMSGRSRDRARRADELANLEAFIDECCLREPSASISSGVLFKAYLAWASRTRRRPMTLVMFGKVITDAGFRKFQRSTIFYEGVNLRGEELGREGR